MVLPPPFNTSSSLESIGFESSSSPSSSASSLFHYQQHDGFSDTTPHDLLHSCGRFMFHGMLEQLGWMFYYIKPNSSLYMSVDDVPNYEVQV